MGKVRRSFQLATADTGCRVVPSADHARTQVPHGATRQIKN